MVTVSLISIVAGMLYMYQSKGWTLFAKTTSFSKLQLDARASLEQIARNLKRCSKDLIYIDTVFNINVPLPEDMIHGKPYLYFAMPQKQQYKAREIKSKDDTVGVPAYDYYLYYFAFAKDKDGLNLQDRARLKLLIVPNQDGEATLANAQEWPFMPREFYGSTPVRDINGVILTGFASTVKMKSLTDEFDRYESFFNFGFYNTDDLKDLLKIRIKMIDKKTNTSVDYETAITPRN